MREIKDVPKNEVPAVVEQSIIDGYITITLKKQGNGHWTITVSK